MSDSKPFEIRANLLELAREILTHNAQMEFEAANRTGRPGEWRKITTDQVVEEAEKLYSFVAKPR